MGSKPYSPSEIHLVSCRPFDIMNPRIEDIRIEDIAHSLSLINRFGGQSPIPWSVARHSLYVYYAADQLKLSPDECGWALLHDAAEAYLGDIIRPLKKTVLFQEYHRLESQLTALIAQTFGLSPTIPATIKDLDNRMLYTEKIHVLKSQDDWGWTAEPFAFDEDDCQEEDWKKTKSKFLLACCECGFKDYESYN